MTHREHQDDDQETDLRTAPDKKREAESETALPPARPRPWRWYGAILATLSLLVMPLSEVLIFAAVMLWVLDASLNVSMEPFRALNWSMATTADAAMHFQSSPSSTKFVSC